MILKSHIEGSKELIHRKLSASQSYFRGNLPPLLHTIPLTPLDYSKPIDMYQYQIDMAQNNSPYLLIESPTGSGKTIIQIARANHYHKQRKHVCILVPKLSIGNGFCRYNNNGVQLNNGQEIAYFEPDFIRELVDNKANEILQILDADLSQEPNLDPQTIVCTYSAFHIAFKKMPERMRKNIAVIIDEAHHCGYDDDTKYTELGSLLRVLINNNIPTTLCSATPYRADGLPLIPEEYQDKFTLIARTLFTHHNQGFCPDFNIHVNFYMSVPPSEYDGLEDDKITYTRIGDLNTLLIEQINQFISSKVNGIYKPTLFVVPRNAISNGKKVSSAKVSTMLYDLLKKYCPDANIMNLGSDDGLKLCSSHANMELRYSALHRKLNTDDIQLISRLPEIEQRHWNNINLNKRGYEPHANELIPTWFDAVISIKTMEEGTDWPDCSAVFTPRISASRVLIMQRDVGRALRRKHNNHPFRDLVDIHFFEIGIKSEDKPKVTDAIWRIALRIKCLCHGVDFQQNEKTISRLIPRKKNDKLVQSINQLATEMATKLTMDLSHTITNSDEYNNLISGSNNKNIDELISKVVEFYDSNNVSVTKAQAMEWLLDNHIISTELVSEIDCDRLNRIPKGSKDFDEFIKTLPTSFRINGIESFVKFLVDDDSGTFSELNIAQAIKEWSTNSADRMKEKLIELAKSGASRPNRKTKEGQSLGSYISKSGDCYNADFDKLIRELAPHWFIDTANIMKEKLIELAKSGASRPNQRTTKEGKSLHNYIYKSSNCYDADFDKLIRELAPHWFTNTASIMKDKLIELAKSGTSRSNQKTKEGQSLTSYTCKSRVCYDADFDKLIRELAPHWFINTASIMKDKLIELAKSGASRPNLKTKEGNSLRNYTCKSRGCYDADFDKLIMELAPHWFKK